MQTALHEWTPPWAVVGRVCMGRRDPGGLRSAIRPFCSQQKGNAIQGKGFTIWVKFQSN